MQWAQTLLLADAAWDARVDGPGQLGGREPTWSAAPALALHLGLDSFFGDNRQAASKLHLSERTVEIHVTNVLSKLCLNSRIQLSRWIADTAG